MAVKIISLKKDIWEDDRGWYLNILEKLNIKPVDTGNIHVVSLNPGAIRGNHYHPDTTEWLLIFGGTASVVWLKKNNQKEIKVIDAEKLPALIEIPPKTVHAIKNDSMHTIHAISINSHQTSETVKVDALFE